MNRKHSRKFIENIRTAYLKRVGYSSKQSRRAIYKPRSTADKADGNLYYNHKAVYSLLRYGVDLKTEAGQPHDNIKLIDWKHPEKNDFAIAEEVTLSGDLERRPDLVLYVNGIAVAVIEL